jgi:hypothetical protein
MSIGDYAIANGKYRAEGSVLDAKPYVTSVDHGIKWECVFLKGDHDE